MPGNEHLLGVPDHMTPEQEWLWNGWSWRRKAYMDQQDLELWIDASVQQAVPVQTNQYLFTTIGPVRTFTVQTVRRSSLVLVVSGLTLLVGLLLIYFPGIRHPSLLFVAGIALTASAASWPEVVLLVVQAALLGGGLANAGLGQIVLAREMLEQGLDLVEEDADTCQDPQITDLVKMAQDVLKNI